MLTPAARILCAPGSGKTAAIYRLAHGIAHTDRTPTDGAFYMELPPGAPADGAGDARDAARLRRRACGLEMRFVEVSGPCAGIEKLWEGWARDVKGVGGAYVGADAVVFCVDGTEAGRARLAAETLHREALDGADGGADGDGDGDGGNDDGAGVSDEWPVKMSSDQVSARL